MNFLLWLVFQAVKEACGSAKLLTDEGLCTEKAEPDANIVAFLKTNLLCCLSRGGLVSSEFCVISPCSGH